MSEFAQSGVPAPGTMHVDFEERVDFARLRTYRLARARDALRSSDLGALLSFDMNNIRYLTSTNIGEWARDKLMRFAVLAGDAIRALGLRSAAKAHRLHSPWLRPEDSRAGMTGLRGSIAPDAGFFARAAREVKGVMDEAGVGDMPLGVDISEIPMPGRPRGSGRRRAGQPADHARRSADQVTRRDHAAVDGRSDGRRRLPGHLRSAEARCA